MERVREPNKTLLHLAGLASESLHARCEPDLVGARTNHALRAKAYATAVDGVYACGHRGIA